jgi:hypothetical protein
MVHRTPAALTVAEAFHASMAARSKYNRLLTMRGRGNFMLAFCIQRVNVRREIPSSKATIAAVTHERCSKAAAPRAESARPPLGVGKMSNVITFCRDDAGQSNVRVF